MKHVQSKPGVAFRSVPGLLYYVQRIMIQRQLRSIIVAGLAAGIRARTGALQEQSPATPEGAKALQQLAESGYTPLQTLLSSEQVADIHSFLRAKQLVNYRDRTNVFSLEDIPDGISIADYTLKDIIDCPHILELANSPRLLGLASEFMGCKPTISAMLLRWSFPRSATSAGVQTFHRDSDDWRFLKIFVYLTDVDAASGPHVYVCGSHLTPSSIRLRAYGDEVVEQTYGRENINVVTGPSGFGFAANTHGVHKGMVPIERPRLVLQIQYSMLPVYAYEYSPETYDGNLALDGYINRLILRPS